MSRVKPRTILLFGGYTEPWIEAIDQIHQRSMSEPWLQQFLNDVASIIRAEVKHMHPKLQDCLGGSNFSSLQEVVDRRRYCNDDDGFLQVIMTHIYRAVALLSWAHENPDALTTGLRPESIGISGGLINAAVLAVSDDFSTLQKASVVAAGLICRLCKFSWTVSRAVEERDDGASWGYAFLGIIPSKLDEILTQVQDSMSVPHFKRVRVGIRGDNWGTAIGPPSVLDACRRHPALKNLDQQKLPILSLQHNFDASLADLEYIVGDSALHQLPVHAEFTLYGLRQQDNGAETPSHSTWGELLLAVVDSAFSKPVDLVEMTTRLRRRLDSTSCQEVTVRLMGPSWFASTLTSKMKSPGRRISVLQQDNSAIGTSTPASSPHVYEGLVAIVGMAGRAPECDDLDQFWQVIQTGQNLVRPIPEGRFDAPQFFPTKEKRTEKNPSTQPKCTSNSNLGCFVKNPGHYDARFFRVSPREALLMDPGSRLFQMVAHEALESAGYSNGPTQTIDPSRIAVVYSQSNLDGYETAHHEKGCDAFTLQALGRPFPPSRISFHYGWEGPTWSIDQACSGSSSAIHQACIGLLVNEFDMALAGGANILASPHGWSILDKMGVLSETGNCNTFRDDVQGYCRGEFVGVVVLKRLEDAVAHNDRILAVIRGSARNQSGNSASITAPDPGAEERCFQQTLRRARLSPSDVSYVEMHGTATPVGDPIEVNAVAKVLGRRKTDKNRHPLTIGAVKANIGHAETASGVASVIKSVFMFRDRILPPQAGFPHAVNPRFPSLEEHGMRILSKSSSFDSCDGFPRRILVNNFDAAGGNTCLLLEEFAGITPEEDRKIDTRSAHVVVLSARSTASQKANRSRLAQWLRANPKARLQDIAYTTTARRIHHPIRFACAVSTTAELIAELESDLARDGEPGTVDSTSKPPIVFVFSGQGSYYAGMGGELYRTNPAFRESLDSITRIADKLGLSPFADIVTGTSPSSKSQRNAAESQLAVLALEIALANMWKRAGVEPSLVIGHSLGEYAALHIAGVLSLADTLYLVGSRAGLLQEHCDGRGSYAMLSVSASAAQLNGLITTLNLVESCGVACVNSPTSTVISGTAKSLALLQSALGEQKIRSKILPLPYGFHSAQVDPLLPNFESLASRVTYLPPKVPVASTLLASILDAKDIFTADYLVQQTRQAVDFVGALHAARAKFDTNPVWLELGPSHTCSSFVQATLSPPHGHVMSSLEATSSPWTSVSKCLAGLYKNGVDLDWLWLHAPFESDLRLLTLPSYAWDVKDYWITYKETTAEMTPNNISVSPSAIEPISTCAQYIVEKSKHPKTKVTLGAVVTQPEFKALVDGHRIQDVAICPGSVFFEAAIAAAMCAIEDNGSPKPKIEDLSLQKASLRRPLLASVDMLQTTAVTESGSVIFVEFKACSNSQSYDLGSCTVVVGNAASTQATWDLNSFYIKTRMDDIIRDCKTKLQAGVFYAAFSRTVEYQNDRYRCVRDAYVSEDFNEAVARVELASDPLGTHFVGLSPYWGEALAHLAGFLVNCHPSSLAVQTTTFIMESLGSFEQTAAVDCGRSYMAYARVLKRETGKATSEVIVFDDEEKIVMRTSGMLFQELPNAVLKTLGGDHTIGTVPNVDGSSRRLGEREHDLAKKSIKFPATKVMTKGALENIPMDKSGPREQALFGRNDEESHPEGQASNQDDPKLFELILMCMAEEIGEEVCKMTDNLALSDLGVDSIMAVEISARVKAKSGYSLSPFFTVQYPTIGLLRRAFGANKPERTLQEQGHQHEHFEQVERQAGQLLQDEQSEKSELPEHQPDGRVEEPSNMCENNAPDSPSTTATSADIIQHTDIPDSPKSLDESMVVVDESVKSSPVSNADNATTLKARIMLLQGRPKANETRLYLISDGCGSVTGYLFLLQHQFSVPVYGIDSPFLRCPSKLTPQVGIRGIARLMVEALVDFHNDSSSPIILGGFSGGAMIAYEMCQQLGELGCRVDGLVLLDMRCPLPPPRPGGTETTRQVDESWDITFETTSQSSGAYKMAWGSNTRAHLKSMYACVATYHPTPQTGPAFHCPAAVIWCAKGMFRRIQQRPDLVRKVAEFGFPTESYPGYMEDPKLGVVAWTLPDKRTESDFGPGGWERFVGASDGGEVGKDLLCLSVDTDHHSCIRPPDATLTYKVMEQSLVYLLERQTANFKVEGTR